MPTAQLKERRYNRRYPIKLPIDLELENGARLSVTTTNISINGLQFHCDNWIARELEPRGIQLHSMDHINLGIFADTIKLKLKGHIVFARRLAQNKYIVGILFVDMDAENRNVLSTLFTRRHNISRGHND